jgi:hypothetical protein
MVKKRKRTAGKSATVNDLMEISGEPEKSLLRWQSRHAESNYYSGKSTC